MPRTVRFTDLGIDYDGYVQIMDAQQASKLPGNDISWGEPAKICLAKMDRACPICGARAKDIQYSSTQLIAGFESDGKDGMCGGCGYTFTTGSDETVETPKNPKKSKPRRRKGKRAARSRNRKGVKKSEYPTLNTE